MRNLVTGQNGFLFSSIRNNLKGELIPYEFGQFYVGRGINRVIHFASPNCRYEFDDKQNMASTMVDYSMAVLAEALRANAKFVFASSVAAWIPTDEYGVYKRFFEQYIQSKTRNHLIYRIPRVYGKEREKGLMKQLRLGDVPEEDMDNMVEYLDISDFRKWFLENLDKTGIIEYDGDFRTNTIREIKELYT